MHVDRPAMISIPVMVHILVHPLNVIYHEAYLNTTAQRKKEATKIKKKMDKAQSKTPTYEELKHRAIQELEREYKKKHGRPGTPSKKIIKQLLKDQGPRCYYCNIYFSESNGFHVDHKIPLARGGRHTVDNFALACPLCNIKKHTKTADEFMCLIDA